MLPLPSAEVSTSWWVSLISMVRVDQKELLGGFVNWNIKVKELKVVDPRFRRQNFPPAEPHRSFNGEN